jgi:hypothetical protein
LLLFLCWIKGEDQAFFGYGKQADQTTLTVVIANKQAAMSEKSIIII